MKATTWLNCGIYAARVLLLGISAILADTTQTALAANIYWDGGTTDIAGNGNGASDGGSGTWDSTIKNWDVGASAHVAWDNSYGAVFAGSGGTVTLSGTITLGNFTLTGNSAAMQITSGTYTFTGGTLRPATGGSSIDPTGATVIFDSSLTISLTAGSQLTFWGGATINSKITGSGMLYKRPGGTLYLTNPNNDFTGDYSSNGGITDFANGALGSSCNILFGNNTLRWGAGNTQDVSARIQYANGSSMDLDSGTNNVVLNSNFSGGFTPLWIEKSGAGSLAMNAAYTFTRPLRITDGTLIANTLADGNTSSSIGKSSSGTKSYNLLLNGGTLQYAPINSTGGGAVSINRGFTIMKDSAIDASGTGPLTFNQTGAIAFDPAARTGDVINNSTNVTSVQPMADLAVGMGVTINGYSNTIASLSASISQLNLASPYPGATASGQTLIFSGSTGNRTLTLKGSNTETNTIAGILRDGSAATLGVTKAGSGLWWLSNVNTYSGTTTIKEGVLMGFVGGSCSNSAVIVTNTPGNISALRICVTNDAMQWTCSSMTFKPNGTGSQLQFKFSNPMGTTTAPLKILGDLTLDNIPTFAVEAPNITPGRYPLIDVGGTIPGQLPALVVPGLEKNGLQARLDWSGKTLILYVGVTGTVISVR